MLNSHKLDYFHVQQSHIRVFPTSFQSPEADHVQSETSGKQHVFPVAKPTANKKLCCRKEAVQCFVSV